MLAINKEYYVNVRELMGLPKPKKKLCDSDGEPLPVVSVDTGLWSYVSW